MRVKSSAQSFNQSDPLRIKDITDARAVHVSTNLSYAISVRKLVRCNLLEESWKDIGLSAVETHSEALGLTLTRDFSRKTKLQNRTLGNSCRLFKKANETFLSPKIKI